MLTQSPEEIKQESFERGERIEKQSILIKLVSKKYGIEGKEKDFIRSITHCEKLDTALEKILFSANKKQVLDCLK